MISILLPLAIKGLSTLIADIRTARRRTSQQLVIGIPLSYTSTYLKEFPTVTKYCDIAGLDSRVIFFRYTNVASALRRCDYVLVDQLYMSDPRVITNEMLEDLIKAYENEASLASLQPNVATHHVYESATDFDKMQDANHNNDIGVN